ncbi:phosphotransferase family protein [Nocardioides ultimimeridianus]
MSILSTPEALAADPAMVVDVASLPRDRVRIAREVAGRAWAVRNGIPTAEVVAADPEARWLVSRRVDDVPGESTAYVEAALEASLRIHAAPPPDFVADTGGAWRAPRWSAPLRVARLVHAGIDPRAFVAARQAVADQEGTVTVHNDFHRGNVLHPADGGGVVVIDWELITLGPRYTDMVQLVVDITEPSLALDAWERLLDAVAGPERRAVAQLLDWLAVRTYASDLSSPRGELAPGQLDRRRARWNEARLWSREWGVS